MKFTFALGGSLVLSLLVLGRGDRWNTSNHLSGPEEVSDDTQGLSYSAWIAAFDARRESLAVHGRVDGWEYCWRGPTPILIEGRLVHRSVLDLDELVATGVPEIVFQPDPVAFADFVHSEFWVQGHRRSPRESETFLQDGEPTDCQVVIVQTGTGTLTTICEGPCGPFMLCVGDGQPPTYCDCTLMGQPPVRPPTRCHGEATLTSPTTILLGCIGSCSSGECEYTSYTVGGLFRAYCACQ